MNIKKGFTLIELMISMTILVMIIGIILAIGVQALRIYRNTYAYQSAQSDEMLALKKMEKVMREAYFIINSSGAYGNISNVRASNGHQISFTIPQKIAGTNPPVNAFVESNNVLTTTEDTTKVIVYFMGDLYKSSNGSIVPCSATDPVSISVGGKPNYSGKTLFRFVMPTATVSNSVYLYPTNQPAKYAILPNLMPGQHIFSYATTSGEGNLSWNDEGDAATRIIRITFHLPVLEKTRKGVVSNAEQTISTQFSIRNFSSL